MKFLCDLGRVMAAAFLVLNVGAATAGTHSRHHTRAHRAPAPEIQDTPLYAAIVVDANGGRILHADKADELRHPASLTKVMTLYMLFEQLEAGRVQLETELPVSEHAASQERTNLALQAGETITVQEAILGLITHSANDAAVVVAEALAGSEPEFADRMTRKARSLGMHRTLYRNASGLPDPEQVTTARDQATLGRAVQQRFPQYYGWFSSTSFVFRGKRLKSHNKLMGKLPGMDGIKTGYIRASKYNLMASVRRNDRHLVAVVLGGPTARSRDARMRLLIEQCLVFAQPGKAELAAATRVAPRPAVEPHELEEIQDEK